VATATEASAVVEGARVHRPDVVILDHVLRVPHRAEPAGRPPAVDSGLSLIAATRAVVPNAVIVMFSGWDGIQPAADDAGADLYIAKPDLDALVPAIRELKRPGFDGDPVVVG
jgi:ActR/RegA family two-component response regulator